MTFTTIVTTEDAQALARLVDYIEKRFPHVDFQLGKLPGQAPTGEPYVELTSSGWSESLDGVIRDAMRAFDEYAKGKEGTLYWRKKPEIGQQHGDGWKFYMRLLISDKSGMSQ